MAQTRTLSRFFTKVYKNETSILPNELLQHVYKFLDIPSMLSARCVDSIWQLNADALYEYYVGEYFPDEYQLLNSDIYKEKMPATNWRSVFYDMLSDRYRGLTLDQVRHHIAISRCDVDEIKIIMMKDNPLSILLRPDHTEKNIFDYLKVCRSEHKRETIFSIIFTAVIERYINKDGVWDNTILFDEVFNAIFKLIKRNKNIVAEMKVPLSLVMAVVCNQANSIEKVRESISPDNWQKYLTLLLDIALEFNHEALFFTLENNCKQNNFPYRWSKVTPFLNVDSVVLKQSFADRLFIEITAEVLVDDFIDHWAALLNQKKHFKDMSTRNVSKAQLIIHSENKQVEYSPLKLACRHDSELVRLIQMRQDAPEKPVDQNSILAFDEVCRRNSIIILNRNFNAELMKQKTHAVMMVVKHGHLHLLKFIMNLHTFDYQQHKAFLCTSLMVSILENHTNITKYLIRVFPRLAKDFILASGVWLSQFEEYVFDSKKNINLLNYLLKHGIEVNEYYNAHQTLLHMISISDYDVTAHIHSLIQYGAEIEMPSLKRKHTALIHACYFLTLKDCILKKYTANNRMNNILCLISHGANIYVTNKDGNSAFSILVNANDKIPKYNGKNFLDVIVETHQNYKAKQSQNNTCLVM